MTESTDTRQLRLLIKGVLAAHGIDNFHLEANLTDGVKLMINAKLPVTTREAYLARIKAAVEKSHIRSEHIELVRKEIHDRTGGLTPSGEDWENFIKFVCEEEIKGKTIAKFLDWWLSDAWNVEHPPTRPNGWRIKWDMAFVAQPIQPAQRQTATARAQSDFQRTMQALQEYAAAN